MWKLLCAIVIFRAPIKINCYCARLRRLGHHNKIEERPPRSECSTCQRARLRFLPCASFFPTFSLGLATHLILIAALCVSASLFADPLNGGLDIGSSISGNYESRDLFINPAALGFQTELDGAGVLSSFDYAYGRGVPDEYSIGLAYGYLGFGVEHLGFLNDTYNRYTVGAGFGLTPSLFLGTRFSFTGSDNPTLSGVHSLDVGLQYRPIELFSLGLLANHLNEPAMAGNSLPIQYVGGLTLHPLGPLYVSMDADTNSNALGHYGYQGVVSVEPLTGLQIWTGYHSDYHWQFGLQLNLAYGSIFSAGQPGSRSKRVMGGIEMSSLPRRSPLELPTALNFKIDSSLGEEEGGGGLFLPAHLSLLDILKTLRDAETDKKVALIVVRLESFPLGYAAAEELSEELFRLKQLGKQIEVFLGNADTKSYLIAISATHIHMEPSGELKFLGPHTEHFYAKGTLDKIGVQGEFLARGKYKSAPELFTRTGPSDPSREATQDELEQMQKGLLAILSKTRGITEAKWRDLLTHAIYSAPDAKGAGLVDFVDSYTQVSEALQSGVSTRGDLVYHSERLTLPPRIAVITADGDILHNKIRPLTLIGESQVTPKKMAKRFEEALSDARTKAIVLRVSSPGGEVLASEQIASMVEKVKSRKPVVVSMGDVAASGGYMISAPATKIFAEPLTVTGSIGVFLGKFNLKGLYDKLDLHKEITGLGPYPGLMSEAVPWTPAERAIMLRELNSYYEGFVGFVAHERHLAAPLVDKVAQGRVWLGKEALNAKLVDVSGGLLSAIEEAAHESGIQGPYETYAISEHLGLFDLFSEDSWLAHESISLPEALTLFTHDSIGELHWISSLSQSPYLYWSPDSIIE